jgi:DNA-binding XRE family transcriptional regulator
LVKKNYISDIYVAVILFVLFEIRQMDKSYTEQIKQFGLKIKFLRETLGLTQQELAYRANIDIRTVQRIEYGESNVTINNLYALAEALNVEPHKLII